MYKKSRIEMKYKDKNPQETVSYIKNILDDLGFDVYEVSEESGAGTYWHRLWLKYKGQIIAHSGGKGANGDYAKASAYAEMLERLQCHYIIIYRQFFSLYNKDILGLDDFIIWPSETKEYNLKNHLDNNKLTRDLLDRDKDDSFNIVESITKNIYKSYGYIPLIQYENALTGDHEDINDILVRVLLGTTGYAAGNTKYEALLQGLCEILERYAKHLIYRDNLCLPEIPERDIKKHEYAYNIYRKVNSSSRFRLELRDASLGKGLPVVCAILYDRGKRGYVVSFGAFPVFEIALERAINELYQYYFEEDIRTISLLNSYDYYNARDEFFNKSYYSHVDKKEYVDFLWYDSSNHTNKAIYKDRFLSDDYDYEYKSWDEIGNKTNEELFVGLCEYIREELDDDVLYYDCSYLGFPSYSIICPKISFDEFFNLKGYYTVNKIDRYFVEEYIYGGKDKNELADLYEDEIIYADLDFILGRPLKNKNGAGRWLFLGYLEFIKGDYTKSALYFDLGYPDYVGTDEGYNTYLDYRECLVNFIAYKQSLKEDEKIKHVMGKMYPSDVIDYIASVCKNPETLANALFVDSYSKICVIDRDNLDLTREAFRVLWDKKKEVGW